VRLPPLFRQLRDDRVPAENLRAAAVLGAVSGLRSFSGAAGLALRGRPPAVWARAAVLAFAGGEAVGDKLPMTPPRSDPPGLVGRVVVGAAVGAATAGARGARVGATFALATTYASERARALLGRRTGIPDPAIAVVEDAIAYGGAWLGAGPGFRPGALPALAAGPVAALVGTGAMTSAQVAYHKLTGSEPSDPTSSPAIDLGFHLVLGLATAAAFEALAGS